MSQLVQHPPPAAFNKEPTATIGGLNRPSRLRSFNEQQLPGAALSEPIASTSSLSSSPTVKTEQHPLPAGVTTPNDAPQMSSASTTTTSTPTTQAAVLQASKNDQKQLQNSKDGIPKTKDDENRSTEETPRAKAGEGNGNKGKGKGGFVNSIWEGMKRMMGFTHECKNGGYSIGTEVCTCPQYFEGQFCERIVCANGGTRTRVATFGTEEVCKCPHPDYISGKHCEVVHCQNGGRLLNDGACHCVEGWYSGQFCQYYTSSWLFAIGFPLLFIAIVVFCCVVCRMDLCALRRHPPPSARSRNGDRRSHGRRRQHQPQQGRQQSSGQQTNRHRCEHLPIRPNDPIPPQHQLYVQQSLLNAQNQQPQQYVLRLEQIPMYNPRLCLPIDKPVEPPPPYEEAVLCPPPSHEPPNYCPTPDGGGERFGMEANEGQRPARDLRQPQQQQQQPNSHDRSSRESSAGTGVEGGGERGNSSSRSNTDESGDSISRRR